MAVSTVRSRKYFPAFQAMAPSTCAPRIAYCTIFCLKPFGFSSSPSSSSPSLAPSGFGGLPPGGGGNLPADGGGGNLPTLVGGGGNLPATGGPPAASSAAGAGASGAAAGAA